MSLPSRSVIRIGIEFKFIHGTMITFEDIDLKLASNLKFVSH